jgi:hypothetical protein
MGRFSVTSAPVQDHARLAPVDHVVGKVAEPAGALLLFVHRRGVGVGGAHPEVRHALVAPPDQPSLLRPIAGDPAVPQRVLSRERSPFFAPCSHDVDDDLVGAFFASRRKRRLLAEHPRQVLLQMALHQGARPHRLERGVGLDLGGVEEQLLAPHEPRFGARLHDPLEEAAEHPKPEAFPDTG